MKKLLSIALLSGLCASIIPVHAFPGFCSPCIHVHHSSDWAGPLAVGAIGGTMLGLAASASSHDRSTCHSRAMIDDLEEQNEILRAKISSLKGMCADLREENKELREENEALRRKIKKLKHGGELMIKVGAGA